MLGLGIGLWSNVAASGDGGAILSPSAIFGANLIAWYEFDSAHCFTDTAGTTPVSVSGTDKIARVNDKSGNGNFLSQVTAGSRPTWNTGASKNWASFAGSHSLIANAAFAIADGTGQHSAGAAGSFTNNTGTQSLLDADGGGTRLSQLIRNNTGTAETIAFASGGAAFTDAGASITAATSTRFIEVTTVGSTNTTEIFVNNASGGATAITGPMQAGTVAPAIGANNHGGGQFMTGNAYCAVLVNRPITSGERASLDSYLASVS